MSPTAQTRFKTAFLYDFIVLGERPLLSFSCVKCSRWDVRRSAVWDSGAVMPYFRRVRSADILTLISSASFLEQYRYFRERFPVSGSV